MYGACRAEGTAATAKVAKVKAAFILDKQRLVHYRSFTSAHLQQNVDELLRRVKAVQELDRHGSGQELLAPATWQPGHQMIPSNPDVKKAYYKQLGSGKSATVNKN
jgi:alkyl hydroperoxide reductase subunit AhpC